MKEQFLLKIQGARERARDNVLNSQSSSKTEELFSTCPVGNGVKSVCLWNTAEGDCFVFLYF